jgi:hypothetical protein
MLRIGFEIGRAVSRAVRAAIGQEAVVGRQRLAHALNILGGIFGGEIPEQFAGGVGAALDEGGVGARHGVELRLRRLVVQRHLDLRRGLGIAADRAAFADAARVPRDDVVLLLEVGDMLHLALVAAHHLGNARTRAAWQQQQHALALGGIDRGRATEAQRDLGAVGLGVVDRHLEAGTFGIRHIAARRPFKRRLVEGRVSGLAKCGVTKRRGRTQGQRDGRES